MNTYFGVLLGWGNIKLNLFNGLNVFFPPKFPSFFRCQDVVNAWSRAAELCSHQRLQQTYEAIAIYSVFFILIGYKENWIS